MVWYESGGGCNTPGYDCYDVTFGNISCIAQGSNPPIVTSCAFIDVQLCSNPNACEDEDGDGYDGFSSVFCGTGNDCDDDNPNVNPGRFEICDDAEGTDENCNGGVNCGDFACQNIRYCRFECDVDRDGYPSNDDACGGEDCDDEESGINPGATEICGEMTGDEDCDGDLNCDDSDCATATECEPIIIGGGGPPDPSYPTYQYCYNDYMVTTYYYCIEGSCTYLYEEWQWVGSGCY